MVEGVILTDNKVQKSQFSLVVAFRAIVSLHKSFKFKLDSRAII